MKLSTRFLALIASMLCFSHAWNLNTLNVPSPNLQKFTQEAKKSSSGLLLDITLDVGKDTDSSRISMKDMLIELLPDNIVKQDAKKYPALPGTNGPNPKSSTGAKSLLVKQDPYFINTQGMQPVMFENGCWELVWRDGASAGSLVCGFHSTQEYTRNDASFPKGRIYLSFPVWTKETLKEAQENKAATEKRAQKYLQEKADAMAKYVAEDNILMKALHYRNALNAHELYAITGVDYLNHIPAEDSDTMVLQDDLLLCTTGTVWTKKDGFFGGQILLGTATASSPEIKGDTVSQLKP